MASEDLAWRTAYAAALEPVGGEDAFLAVHREMNRMLDNAGSGFGIGVRFDPPEFPSLASAWSRTEMRGGHIAISKTWHGERG
jgi:hypothetical protein